MQDVSEFIDARIAEHHEMLGDPLARLRKLAGDTAERNPDVPGLAAIDQMVAFFCNDLRECCRREETMVFPALLRLRAQTSIRDCHAGAVRARLRFAAAEQDALAA